MHNSNLGFGGHSKKDEYKGEIKHSFSSQIYGKTERTIKTLEDMLRACIIYFKGNWDNHLSLVEFY